jgi:TPR repeat protein
MKKETVHPTNQMHSRIANPEREARGMGVKVRERKGMYRHLTFGLLSLLFTISMAVSAYSGQFEDAKAAYKRGDHREAYRLFKPLAQQGIPEAQYNLALMYYNGRGAPQDYILAHMWFNLAASRFPDSEKKKRYDAVSYRDVVASMMTPYQIAEAQQLAREWKPKKEVR